MAELSFNWRLYPTTNMHKKNRAISKMEINAEWSLVCLWSQDEPQKPEFLEICRNTTVKDIIISGTLNLMREGGYFLQQKFAQLFSTGFATTLIDLEYSNKFFPISTSFNCAFQFSRDYTIQGTLIVSDHVVSKESTDGIQFKSLLELSNDFECLLDPKTNYFSDVILNCGIVSLAAHKNILSARSPVFAAMFATNMKENLDNKVEITDLNLQVLKMMLAYIYTGKTGELSVQSAGELLFAADKYQLQGLKRVCSDYLQSSVSVENILKILVLGELHNEELKAFAFDYICNSCDKFEVLEKTAEWKYLSENNPALAMDVLIHLVKSKEQKLNSCK